MTKVLLASASPRRAELLSQLGVQFEQRASNIDESVLADEKASDYVCRMALEKSRAAMQHDAGAADWDGIVVLGSDTSVVLGSSIFGKPASQTDAQRMLAALAGRQHTVMTAVATIYQGAERVILQSSDVWMRALSEQEIQDYWETGEPLGKAGGYAIQGRAAQFIRRIDGSYSGIMGLPLYETAELLSRCGVRVL